MESTAGWVGTMDRRERDRQSAGICSWALGCWLLLPAAGRICQGALTVVGLASRTLRNHIPSTPSRPRQPSTTNPNSTSNLHHVSQEVRSPPPRVIGILASQARRPPQGKGQEVSIAAVRKFAKKSHTMPASPRMTQRSPFTSRPPWATRPACPPSFVIWTVPVPSCTRRRSSRPSPSLRLLRYAHSEEAKSGNWKWLANTTPDDRCWCRWLHRDSPRSPFAHHRLGRALER